MQRAQMKDVKVELDDTPHHASGGLRAESTAQPLYPPQTVLVRWKEELLLLDAWDPHGRGLRTPPSLISEAIVHFDLGLDVSNYRLAIRELVDGKPRLLYLGISALRFVEDGRVLELIDVSQKREETGSKRQKAPVSPATIQAINESISSASAAAESKTVCYTHTVSRYSTPHPSKATLAHRQSLVEAVNTTDTDSRLGYYPSTASDDSVSAVLVGRVADPSASTRFYVTRKHGVFVVHTPTATARVAQMDKLPGTGLQETSPETADLSTEVPAIDDEEELSDVAQTSRDEDDEDEGSFLHTTDLDLEEEGDSTIGGHLKNFGHRHRGSQEDAVSSTVSTSRLQDPARPKQPPRLADEHCKGKHRKNDAGNGESPMHFAVNEHGQRHMPNDAGKGLGASSHSTSPDSSHAEIEAATLQRLRAHLRSSRHAAVRSSSDSGDSTSTDGSGMPKRASGGGQQHSSKHAQHHHNQQPEDLWLGAKGMEEWEAQHRERVRKQEERQRRGRSLEHLPRPRLSSRAGSASTGLTMSDSEKDRRARGTLNRLSAIS